MTLVPVAANLSQVAGPIRSGRPDDWMLRQLPMQMLSDDFFVRFVSIFQEVGSTLLEDADQIDHLLDLGVSSPEMVRWMGSWIGLVDIDAGMEEGLQRRVVASTARTLAWRGTTVGLRCFLELLSGGAVEVVEGGGIWRAGEVPADTAWVRMWVAGTGAVDLASFVQMVRDEIPAHVRGELYVADDLVWDSEQDLEW